MYKTNCSLVIKGFVSGGFNEYAALNGQEGLVDATADIDWQFDGASSSGQVLTATHQSFVPECAVPRRASSSGQVETATHQMFVPESSVPRPSQRLKHKTAVSAKGKHLKSTYCYLVLLPNKTNAYYHRDNRETRIV